MSDSDATIAALKNLNLTTAGYKWLENMIKEISLAALRGEDSKKILTILLERKWVMNNIPGRTREDIYTLLVDMSQKELGNTLLFIRHSL